MKQSVLKVMVLSLCIEQGFPVSQPFLPATPMFRYWRFGDPKHLMIMMIILRFCLLLVVFYDDFHFPYWRESYFYFYICLNDPLLKVLGIPTPRLGNPGVRTPRLGNHGIEHSNDEWTNKEWIIIFKKWSFYCNWFSSACGINIYIMGTTIRKQMAL